MRHVIGLFVVVIIIAASVIAWFRTKKAAGITLNPMNEQQLIHWVKVELSGNSHVTDKKSAIAHLQQQGAIVNIKDNMFIVTLH